MKYPKEWIEAADARVTEGPGSARYWLRPKKILDALDKVGALKDVPKPRKFKVCEKCETLISRPWYLNAKNYGTLCPDCGKPLTTVWEHSCSDMELREWYIRVNENKASDDAFRPGSIILTKGVMSPDELIHVREVLDED